MRGRENSTAAAVEWSELKPSASVLAGTETGMLVWYFERMTAKYKIDTVKRVDVKLEREYG